MMLTISVKPRRRLYRAPRDTMLQRVLVLPLATPATNPTRRAPMPYGVTCAPPQLVDNATTIPRHLAKVWRDGHANIHYFILTRLANMMPRTRGARRAPTPKTTSRCIPKASAQSLPKTSLTSCALYDDAPHEPHVKVPTLASRAGRRLMKTCRLQPFSGTATT